MVKTKWIYIIGSIIIGLVTVIGVFFALMATGVISTERYKLVLVSASAQKEYDGTALVCEEWELAEGALKDGHVLQVNMLGKAIDAGDYANNFTVTITDAVGADVTDDYEIESNFGTLHIAKKVVHVRTSSAEKTYDDQPLSSEGWELLPNSNVLKGHTLSVTTTSVANKIGVIYNEAIATVTAGEKDVTFNYDIQYEYGTLTIFGHPLIVSSDSASKTYDGTPLTRESYTCKSRLKEGHRLEVVFDASLTEAGEIENFFIVTVYDGTEDVTRYYSVEKRMGKLKVNPRPITLRSGSDEKEYDGTPLECHEYEVVSMTNVLPKHELFVSYAGQQLNGGISDNEFAQILIGYYDNDGKFIDETANYEITTKLGTLKVTGDPNEENGGGVSGDLDGDGIPDDFDGDGIPDGGVPGDSDGDGIPDGGVPGDFDGDGIPDDFDGDGIPDGGNMNGENPGENLSQGVGESATDLIKVYSENNARIYLRNTSYGDYNGQVFTAGESYDKLLDDTYCYNYLFSIFLQKAGLVSHTVKIQSYSEYVLPYYMEKVREGYATPTNDVLYSGDIRSVYTVSYYQYDYTDLIKDNYFDGLTLGAYAAEAREYETFVRNQYLSIPNTTRAYLNAIISEQGFDVNDPQILYKVAKYVQNAATYDLEYPTSLDTEEDVVISFLRDYKTGVCRHYAKAGTMLFRALGIPARYVTGFMIDAKAKEWTSTKIGHAWVEVYLSGLGWIQVEVTGSMAGEGFDSKFDNNGNQAPGQRVIVRPATVAVQYDGSNSAVPTDKIASFALEDQGYSYEMTATGSQTVVGKGKSTIVKLLIYNPDEELIYHYENKQEHLNTENLDIELQAGILHLYISKLTFTSYSESKVYDGAILRASGIDWEWAGSLEEGHSIGEVKFTSGTLLNVGSKANTFTVSLVDAEGKDVTDLYLIEKRVGTLSISHREITLTADSQTFMYLGGGHKFTCDTYQVDSEQNPDKPLADNNTITLRMTSDSYIYNRGFVSNEIDVSSIQILDAEGNDITANYIIHTQTGVLIVK